MFGYMLRKMLKLLNLAKIFNIIAFVFLLFSLAGSLFIYDWSSMPYSTTSSITVGGTLFSIAIFGFLSFTVAFSFYVLRRVQKEKE